MENVARWVASRFGGDAQEQARITYLISRKIAYQGVNPSLFMEAGFDAVEAMIPAIAEETGYEYMARMGV
jgi:hypothetical protein